MSASTHLEYAFRGGRIAEVRAHYRWIPGEPISELGGFPDAERGYPDGPERVDQR